MKLSKEFAKNLNLGIVTEEMIGEALYSFDERAKNYREKETQVREKAKRYGKVDDPFFNAAKYASLYLNTEKMKSKILKYFNPTELHCFKSEGREQLMFYYEVGAHSFYMSVEESDETREGMPVVEFGEKLEMTAVDAKELISKQSARKILDLAIENAREAGVKKMYGIGTLMSKEMKKEKIRKEFEQMLEKMATKEDSYEYLGEDDEEDEYVIEEEQEAYSYM